MVYSILESVEVILVNWDLREEWWGVISNRCVSCKKKKKEWLKAPYGRTLCFSLMRPLFIYIDWLMWHSMRAKKLFSVLNHQSFNIALNISHIWTIKSHYQYCIKVRFYRVVAMVNLPLELKQKKNTRLERVYSIASILVYLRDKDQMIERQMKFLSPLCSLLPRPL